ncbi:DUF805 domain-containing protein [Rhodobacteraceae bacterium KN286]|uniref:DUF805 domain-containing protein n=1 Tax=Oceanomicrobium pacificus TaxID=2692916 RepID=A0A6B0U0R3_9RHOB|nr:DUF805 domain-containing protein [Oceanomicrobium pacificus]
MRRYADFSGRASRSEFWYFFLACTLIVGGLFTAVFVLTELDDIVGLTAIILAALVYLSLLLPQLASFVRRLHDQDRRGWWVLVYFLPLGLPILLAMMALPGTAGDNRFGPVPPQ